MELRYAIRSYSLAWQPYVWGGCADNGSVKIPKGTVVSLRSLLCEDRSTYTTHTYCIYLDKIQCKAEYPFHVLNGKILQ